jgi:hypothetical protein
MSIDVQRQIKENSTVSHALGFEFCLIAGRCRGLCDFDVPGFDACGDEVAGWILSPSLAIFGCESLN